MAEWKEYKLGDVCDLVPGFAFKSKDFGAGDNRAIKIKDIQPPYVETKDADYVDVSAYDEMRLSKFLVNKGEFLLAMTGATIGKIGKYIDNEPSYVNQRVLKFKDTGTILYNYLYYYLSTDTFQGYINNHIDSQSAQPNISANTIGKYPIVAPDKETQRQIASILSSLDDKIELNRKINANLEAQAQALFKSWFVDFEPFKDQPFVESELGMIPEGWRVVSLGDLMSYNGGSQPPASEFIEEYKEGYVRFVQIRDYASDGHITYIPISKRNKLCDVRDIMIARYGASLGRICYGLKGAYNVALAKVTPNKPYYLEYLRCFLNTREFYEGINNKGNRAVQAGFNQSDIQSFRVAFPENEEIIQKFENICSAFFDKRLHLEQESRRLASLRDTLLPRLMSGELKVNDINI